MRGVQTRPATRPARRAAPVRAARRHATVLWLVAACLGVVVAHLALARAMPAPFLYHDETGYLANARLLAGLDAVPVHPNSPFYHLGYSILVAPIYLLPMGPEGVYQGVLVLNALLGAALVLALYPLGRRLLRLTPGRALVAAVVTAAYPAFLLNGNIAWSENALVPLFALWVLLGLRAATGRHTAWAYAAGFAATGAGLYLVHPRALPLAALTLAFLALLGARRRLAGGATLIAMGVLVLGLAASHALNGWARDTVYSGGTGTFGANSTARRVLEGLTTPGDWPDALLRASGQIWYLSVSSLGLWTIGVAYLGVVAVRRRGSVQMAAGLTLASVAATLAVSSLYLVDGARIDWLFYGRYVEGVAAVPILAGVGALLTLGSRRHRLAAVGGAVALGALSGAAMYLGNGADAFGADAEGGVQPVTILGILGPAGVDWPALASFDVGQASAVALVAVALVAAVLAGTRRAAAGALAILFLVSAFVAEPRAVRSLAEGVNAFVTITDAARSLPGSPPVDYDMASFSPYGATAYSFWLDDSQLRLIDTDAGDVPEQVGVLSGAWEGEALGARVMALESRQDQALWVMPGALQDRLAAEGRVFPGPVEAPLPPAALRSRMTLEGGRARITLPAGGARTLDVDLTHSGAGSPWRQRGLVPGVRGAGTVSLLAFWRPGDATAPFVAVQAAELPKTLPPGETASLPLRLGARDAEGAPLAPGDYVVRIGPYQDGLGPFASFGDAPLDLAVTLTAP